MALRAGLLHLPPDGAWHGALHEAGCPLLFVSWNKRNPALLHSPVWTDRSHLHRWAQVAAAAVCSTAEDAGFMSVHAGYMADG